MKQDNEDYNQCMIDKELFDKEQTETFDDYFNDYPLIIETLSNLEKETIKTYFLHKFEEQKQLHEQEIEEKDKEIKELTKTILYTNNNYINEYIKVKEKDKQIEELKKMLRVGDLI